MHKLIYTLIGDKNIILRKIIIKLKKFKFDIFDRYFFNKAGRNNYIGKTMFITPKYISMGSNIAIWKNCRIEGINKYNNILFTPHITIEDEVSIQQNLHLTCANSIYIGEKTAIASNVTITDINHPYEDINKSIESQDIEYKFVYIGAGCKIYNNAVILPGTKIGSNCVIGANSVVNGIDIPDYSVVVGSPAKVIKRYNLNSNKWEKTDKDGNFIEL